MLFLRKKFAGSPDYARVAPFAVFVVLTTMQGQLGEDSRYWLYLVKTLVGAWLIWEMRPFVEEMRWRISWEAVVVGVAVFAVWVGLDGLYPRLGELDAGWNPNKQFGEGSALAWLYVVVRIAGSSIVVPPLEEAFYRSVNSICSRLWSRRRSLDYCTRTAGWRASCAVWPTNGW
jgi:hypothetical protein